MADSKKPHRPRSIAAFIEQTAKMLRSAASKTLPKKEVSKEAESSTSGKVERIAKFLRAEGRSHRKRARRKTKKD